MRCNEIISIIIEIDLAFSIAMYYIYVNAFTIGIYIYTWCEWL